MAAPEFKAFNVIFHHVEYCAERQSWSDYLKLVEARSLIRGCLMFNDLDFQDDPWDYNLDKNK